MKASSKMKTHDKLALALLGALIVFGALSFFFKPQDPESAKDIIEGLLVVFSNVMTYKFTKYQAASTLNLPDPPASAVKVQVTDVSAKADLIGGKVSGS